MFSYKNGFFSWKINTSYGVPAWPTLTCVDSIRPLVSALREASSQSGAAHRNNVLPSWPPRATAKIPSGVVSIVSKISPPSAIRTARWFNVSAIQTAPSASSASPSGKIVALSIRLVRSGSSPNSPKLAKSRLSPNVPSSLIVNWEILLPNSSLTISVLSSGDPCRQIRTPKLGRF